MPLYLLIESCYPILRRWKTSRGWLFDRKVLKANPLILSEWKNFDANAVVPVPQRFLRAWKMGGSRAERIGEWVSQNLKIPLVHALSPPSSPFRREKRQAELSLEERLHRRIQFKIRDEELRGFHRIILVDDFMTSGKTLEHAAKTLRDAGAQKVHVFCLGVKVPRLDSEGRSDLLKSPRGTISICQK